MMLRALIWKEYREQRPLVLAGLGLAVALPFLLMAGASTTRRGAGLAELSGMLPWILAVFCWPILTSVC